MSKEKLERIWCKPSFKKFLFEKKAENPQMKLHDILDKIVENERSKTNKNKRCFFGKI